MKIKNILVILLVILIVFPCSTYATTPSEEASGGRNYIINPDYYNPGVDSDVKNASKLLTMAQKIIAYLSAVGTIISVISLAIIGIKYLIASVEEKAEYKKNMIPYITGLLLLFGTTVIVSIISEIVTSVYRGSL